MKEILLVTIGFSPNVGGIETHFDDLTKSLDERGWKTWILTYKPITTKVKAKIIEKKGKNIIIYRIPWINGVFYKLVEKPYFEFLFLVPPLFLILPIFLLLKGKNINTIHSHGLIAGFVSVFWGKIFGKYVITTTHSIYNFPKLGPYKSFAKWIFASSDLVLTLSNQSKKEIEALGISSEKVKVFTYWIDLNVFKRLDNAKKLFGWENFTALFVGRLVEVKGVKVLMDSFNNWSSNINLAIIGSGPLEEKVKDASMISRNFIFVGRVENRDLPKYYSAADILIVPSIHEEGFGRVILESLACGTPVIGSNRGAIPEAMDNTVGKLIEITSENITKCVKYYNLNKNELEKLSRNARKLAQNKYSEKNAETIIQNYK